MIDFVHNLNAVGIICLTLLIFILGIMVGYLLKIFLTNWFLIKKKHINPREFWEE